MSCQSLDQRRFSDAGRTRDADTMGRSHLRMQLRENLLEARVSVLDNRDRLREASHASLAKFGHQLVDVGISAHVSIGEDLGLWRF